MQPSHLDAFGVDQLDLVLRATNLDEDLGTCGRWLILLRQCYSSSATIVAVDLLSLVQWLGCLAALGGGTVVAWLAEPAEAEVRPDGRGRTAMAGVMLLLSAFVAWWFMLDPGDDDLARQASALVGMGAGLSLVCLVVLLASADGIRATAWPTYRRAAGVMMAGFGAAASSSLQVALVGVGWGLPGWLAIACFLVACAVVVLAQPVGRGVGH